MPFPIAPNSIKFEAIRPASIHSRDEIKHIVPVFIHCAQWRACSFGQKQLESFRRITHAPVWIDFSALRMRDDQQLQMVNKHRLLKLVGHAQFKATVLFL